MLYFLDIFLDEFRWVPLLLLTLWCLLFLLALLLLRLDKALWPSLDFFFNLADFFVCVLLRLCLCIPFEFVVLRLCLWLLDREWLFSNFREKIRLTARWCRLFPKYRKHRTRRMSRRMLPIIRTTRIEVEFPHKLANRDTLPQMKKDSKLIRCTCTLVPGLLRAAIENTRTDFLLRIYTFCESVKPIWPLNLALLQEPVERTVLEPALQKRYLGPRLIIVE